MKSNQSIPLCLRITYTHINSTYALLYTWRHDFPGEEGPLLNLIGSNEWACLGMSLKYENLSQCETIFKTAKSINQPPLTHPVDFCDRIDSPRDGKIGRECEQKSTDAPPLHFFFESHAHSRKEESPFSPDILISYKERKFPATCWTSPQTPTSPAHTPWLPAKSINQTPKKCILDGKEK
jgi:hypothetical protein